MFYVSMVTLLIIFCAKYLIFLFIAPLTFFWMGGQQKLLRRTFFGGALAYILAIIIGFVFPVLRPFEKTGSFPILPVFFFEQYPQLRTASFPSKHMAAAVLISLVVMSQSKFWGAVFLILAFLVGWGRVAAQVHTWWDILGGAVLGLLCTFFVAYITRQ